VSTLTFATRLHPPPIIPALLYLIPVAIATVVGGRAAGVTGLVCSTIGLEFLFLPPLRSWHVGSLTTVGTGRVDGWLVLAVFVAVGAIAVELVARERDARRRAAAAESRLALLSEVSGVLSRSFDYEKTLHEAALIASHAFGGMALIRLRGDGEREERLVAAHADPEHDDLLQGLTPPLELGGLMDSLPAPHDRSAVISARDEFLRAIAGAASNLAILRQVAASTWILAPMVASETMLGAFAVTVDGSARIGAADEEVVADLADRTALAVSRALLFGNEERAREEAVAAAGRTARIQTFTAALSASVSPDEVGAIIVREARDALGADRAAVYEFSPDDGVATLLAAAGYTDAELAPYRTIVVDEDRPLPTSVTALGRLLLGTDARERVDRSHADARYPPDPAAVVVPLLLKGRLGGHLFLGFAEARALGLEEVEMLRTLAGICAQVLDRARLVQQEQAARATAEQSALRLSLVSRASALLAVELD
jgi:GAF domain-containing protein